MTIWFRNTCIAVGVAVVALAGTSTNTTATSRTARKHLRLDLSLQAAADAGSRDPQRVIISVRPGSRSAVRSALAARGDQILAEHDSIDAITAVVRGEDLETFGSHDGVVSVSRDAVVRAHGLLGGVVGGLLGAVVNVLGIILPGGADTSGPVVSPAILRQTLGVDSTSWTGKGIGVAVIDSGLENSSDFYNRVVASYDFRNGASAVAPLSDEYGHGTHVAGTIGSSGANSYDSTYRGLAPKVKFVILKVLDKTGAGLTSDVIRAVDFAVANKTTLGIDIINLSLGHPIYEPAASDPLVQTVERASRAGIVVVAAAGNYGKNPKTGEPGYAGITSPGNAPSAITV
ncbi:MAG: hypothetical protein DMG00_26295, partial [Acidobacteria bacterium]